MKRNDIIAAIFIAALIFMDVMAIRQESILRKEIKQRNAMIDIYRGYYTLTDSLVWECDDADTHPVFDKWLEVREDVAMAEYEFTDGN